MCASKKSFIINKFLIIKFLFNNETLYLGDLNHYSKFMWNIWNPCILCKFHYSLYKISHKYKCNYSFIEWKSNIWISYNYKITHLLLYNIIKYIIVI